MRISKKIINFSFLGIGIFVGALSLSFLIINRSSSVTMSINSTSCSGFSILAQSSGSGTATSTLSGISSIDVVVPTSSRQIGQIIMNATDSANQKKVIGRAQTSSTNKWTFKWATALWPSTNSPIKLTADVSYLGDGSSCTVESTTRYAIINNLAATMTVTLVGQTEPVSVGSTSDYSVISTVNGTSSSPSDLSQYSIIKWSTSSLIGILSSNPTSYPNDTQRIFNAGKEPGSNTIFANVIYGGADVSQSKTITIKPLETTPNSTNSVTSPTTPTATTTTNSNLITSPLSTSSNTVTTTQLTSSQVQVPPATKSCVEEILTTKRYTEINSGDSRPTASESTKVATCFAPSKYILPSNFSPIDPAKVSDLESSDIVSVSNLENETIKVDSKDKQTLKITGKTTPNSTVILYIYSDPLIITTKSDSDGNWQYTIEDPLEPGKHEVYAIVDNGDGVYKRSDPMSFLISTASATDANPNGLGLTLSEPPKKTPTQSNINLIIYIAGSIAVLIVAFAGLYLIVRSHHKHKIKIAQINKSAVIDNLECPHCNNLVGGVKKNDVQPSPINSTE